MRQRKRSRETVKVKQRPRQSHPSWRAPYLPPRLAKDAFRSFTLNICWEWDTTAARGDTHAPSRHAHTCLNSESVFFGGGCSCFRWFCSKTDTQKEGGKVWECTVECVHVGGGGRKSGGVNVMQGQNETSTHGEPHWGGSWTPQNRAGGSQPLSVQLRTHAHARAHTAVHCANTRTHVDACVLPQTPPANTFPPGTRFKSKCASSRRAVHAAAAHPRDFAVETKWSRDSLKFEKGHTRRSSPAVCLTMRPPAGGHSFTPSCFHPPLSICL